MLINRNLITLEATWGAEKEIYIVNTVLCFKIFMKF